MPTKYGAEVQAWAARMVRDPMAEHKSVTVASAAVGSQIGVSRDMLQRWVS